MKNLNQQKGIAALIAILVVNAVILVIALMVNRLGLNLLNNDFLASQSAQSFYAAESCAEEALLRLKRDAYYGGGTLTVGNSSCTASVTNTDSNNYQIAIQSIASLTNFTVRHLTILAQVIIVQGSNNIVSTKSWLEQ